MNPMSRFDLIRDLRERIAASRPPAPAAAEARTLDQLLCGEGLEPGSLVEWQNTAAGSGAVTLALTVAAKILRRGGAFVAIDDAGEFYPPAFANLGIPLDRTVFVRPRDPRSSLWAWEQVLRCGAVAVTLGQIDAATDRHLHRLQLAVETGGGLGFLLRPPGSRGTSSKAAVRLRVEALPSAGPLHSLGRRLRVELLHCRGGTSGATVELELAHETSDVRLVDPAPVPIAAHA